MHLSEIMTTTVLYHVSGFRNFKTYYFYLHSHHRSEFPTLISYNRFVECMNTDLNASLNILTCGQRGSACGDTEVAQIGEARTAPKRKATRRTASKESHTIAALAVSW